MIAPQNPPRHGEGDHAKRGGGGSPVLRRPEVYVARKQRRQMSLPEVLIWQRVKGGKAGFSFRKQHPIGPYSVDFYISEASLVIEIDGEAHERGAMPQHDASKDAFLIENGYRVMRITAAEVLRDVNAAVEGIVAFAARPLHHPADGPPPRAGEDF